MQPTYNPYNFKNKLISKSDISKIISPLTYEVKDIQLFREAMTHSSYVKRSTYSTPTGEPSILEPCPDSCVDLQNNSYQRLEFLGDKEIGKAVANYLFERYTKSDEEFLTKTVARIVQNKTLGPISKDLGLDNFLIISRRVEEITKLRSNIDTLADIFEAFIGALWKDSHDSNLIYKFIVQIIETHLNIIEIIISDNDYKGQFQKHCQKTKGWTPKWIEIGSEGIGLEKIFIVAVMDPDEKIQFGVGRGKKKQDAAQEASKIALEKIKRLV